MKKTKYIFNEGIKILMIVVLTIAFMVVVTYTNGKEIEPEEGMASVEVTVKEAISSNVDYSGIPFMTRN